MELDTFLNLPAKAQERVLDLIVSGKVDLTGVNVWVDDPTVPHENVFLTPNDADPTSETDLIIIDGTVREQRVDVYQFEVGRDLVLVTGGVDLVGVGDQRDDEPFPSPGIQFGYGSDETQAVWGIIAMTLAPPSTGMPDVIFA